MVVSLHVSFFGAIYDGMCLVESLVERGYQSGTTRLPYSSTNASCRTDNRQWLSIV